MDLGRWPQADRILDEALSLPAQERAAYIRRAAAGDDELARRLEAVVAESTSGDEFLPPGGALDSSLRDELASHAPAPTPAVPALQRGDRIEHYEVLGLIGRGGMGEVYRARDLRLEREVALKVLPEMSSRDVERRARFRREARVLAMLSHPGIAAIYGVAEADSIEALVLELVQGPTLADRLQSGALPLAEVLSIGTHLAEAITAAHARGILHRDLKPANIKVAADGNVKVLDFGLAKALAPDRSPVSTDLTAATPHVLLGTAAYMSPEQIRGTGVDARADIWAFGCILFEMLTGARAFAGDSVNDVLARVIERDPQFAQLPSHTPVALHRLLRRTLAKDPDRRLGYIGDARLELQDSSSDAVPDRTRSRVPHMALLAGALAIGAAIGGVVTRRSQSEPAATVSRFVMPLGAGESPVTGFQPMLALSPDGRTLVYRARRDGVARLFRRELADLESTAIPGTENATGPFFSPDGRWLGFDSDGVLKRIALAGGLPVSIASAPGGVTATWAGDDTIVFATNTSRVLQRVAASGGEPETITALDPARGDTLHALPHALPDGRTVLFTIVSGASHRVAAIDLGSRVTRVLADGSHPRWLQPDIVVLARGGALWAVEASGRGESLTLKGKALPVVDRIQNTDNTVLHYDVSSEGSVAYLPAGQAEPELQNLLWIDRQGRRTPVNLEPRPYTRVSLSPDGTRLAFAMTDRGNTDIWVADPDRRTTGRLTVDPTIETSPTWSPDGRFIAFRSEREGPGVFRRDADGAGPIERLTTTDGPIHSPYSWTPDGRTLLMAVFRSFSRQAIGSVTPPDPTVHILLDGEFAQLDPQVSPGLRWMAYQSDETGRFEVYVRPYPNVQSARWQVSTSGGSSPRWSPNGRELFYYDGSGLMSVPVTAGPRFAASAPARLFNVESFGGRFGPDYEVTPDGNRFLFIVAGPATATSAAHLVFVQHWAEELRKRIHEGK